MEKIVSYTWDEMDELAKHSKTDWEKLKNMKDTDIDFSDFPELTDEQLKKLRRVAEKHTLKNKLFKSISIRLNPGTLQKLRSSGKGWQTRLRDAIDKLVKDKVL